MMGNNIHLLALKANDTITSLIYEQNEAAGLVRGDGRLTHAERDAAYAALIVSADTDLAGIMAGVADASLDAVSLDYVEAYRRQAACGFADNRERARLGLASIL